MALYVSLMVIRITFRARHHDIRRRLINPEEGVGNIVARWALGTLTVAAIAAYFVAPRRLAWFFVPLPIGVRVAAVAGSACCLGLLVWSHVTLDSQFTSTLKLGSHHQLVTAGPYRFVQHPIYVSFFGLFLFTGVFTRAWPIGTLGMLTIGTLMTTRRVREEAMLRERHGTQYEIYQSETSRFVPLKAMARAFRGSEASQ